MSDGGGVRRDDSSARFRDDWIHTV
jgi:hypothetical protein